MREPNQKIHHFPFCWRTWSKSPLLGGRLREYLPLTLMPDRLPCYLIVQSVLPQFYLGSYQESPTYVHPNVFSMGVWFCQYRSYYRGMLTYRWRSCGTIDKVPDLEATFHLRIIEGCRFYGHTGTPGSVHRGTSPYSSDIVTARLCLQFLCVLTVLRCLPDF